MIDNYKSILWVEDNPPTNPVTGEIDQNEIGELFGKHKDCVRLEKDVLKALKYIRDNIGQFDVAVLDINLEDGITNNYDKISSLLEKSQIIALEADKLGFSIFQYLLILGFPIDRIIFRTANDDTYEEYRKIFEEAHFSIPNKVSDKSSNDLENKISELYNNDNSYFQVRKIVFEAIGYWLNNSAKKSQFSESEVDRILHEVIAQLPLRPANSLKNGNKSFREYQAVLGTLAAPFETEVNLTDPYQQVMKLLRNWTAHGKFNGSNELDERIFLLLFLTAMRAYFSSFSDNEDRLGYEDEAFNFLSNKEKIPDEKRKEHIYSFYYKTHDANQLNIKLYDTLNAMGRKKEVKLNYGYLLEILLSYGLGVSLKIKKPENADFKKFTSVPLYLNFAQENNKFLNGIIECLPDLDPLLVSLSC